MEYNTDRNSSTRLILLGEMEKQFDERNVPFFESLLDHEDYVIRTRSVCILANIAGEKAVESIAKVLKNDADALVRHEAAFLLVNLGSQVGLNRLLRL